MALCSRIARRSRITRGMLQLSKSATDVKTLSTRSRDRASADPRCDKHRLEIDIPNEPRCASTPNPLACVRCLQSARQRAKYTDAGGVIEVWARAMRR